MPIQRYAFILRLGQGKAAAAAATVAASLVVAQLAVQLAFGSTPLAPGTLADPAAAN